MSNLVIYRKNDNLIEWQFLMQATDAAYRTDAVVTFSLYSGYALNSTTGARSAGTLVSGPTTMSYVAGSNGTYQGKLPASVDLDLSLVYTIEINATAGGHTARRSIPVTVTDRVV